MPVVDDEQQLPMFLRGSEDPGRDLLVHVVDVQAEAIRNLTGLLRIAGLLKDEANGLESQAAEPATPAPRPRPQKKVHRPQNKAFREWHSFRAHCQLLEKQIRKDLSLGPDDELELTTVYSNGGPTPRSMRRHMQYHGLRAEQWPPSTWPETAPPRPAAA
jgi:hypothetical protein